MKKSFASYFIGWLAAIGLFNVIVFVTPNEIGGESKFTTLFWIGYAFITLFFIGQLACAYFVFRAGSLQKTFYNLALIDISVYALVAMLIVGGLCMAIIPLPTWIGIIACAAILAFSAISVTKATVAISAVAEVDKKVKTKTMFIKLLTADAQSLVTKASDDKMRELSKKVFEAVRYSDPMSDPALGAVEDKISDSFNELSAAIEANNPEAAELTANKLLALISERNAKCKILK